MANPAVPHFCNDAGVARIRIGVSEFQCMGASPPHDHPHVFLDMGNDSEIICPYCSTIYVRDDALQPGESEPPGCRASVKS
jgi:uncharacterized Zn-finger protein